MKKATARPSSPGQINWTIVAPFGVMVVLLIVANLLGNLSGTAGSSSKTDQLVKKPLEQVEQMAGKITHTAGKVTNVVTGTLDHVLDSIDGKLKELDREPDGELEVLPQ